MQSLLLALDPHLTWFEAFVRIGAAAGLGGIIGLERELDEKAAGLRTHMLVAVGSALFTLVGAYGFEDFPATSVDPTRIAAQVVTGIGWSPRSACPPARVSGWGQ
jgi:putative Mg2+ transporter-C (MgtC) family protein